MIQIHSYIIRHITGTIQLHLTLLFVVNSHPNILFTDFFLGRVEEWGEVKRKKP